MSCCFIDHGIEMANVSSYEALYKFTAQVCQRYPGCFTNHFGKWVCRAESAYAIFQDELPKNQVRYH